MNTVTVQLSDKQYELVLSTIDCLLREAESIPSDDYEDLRSTHGALTQTKSYLWLSSHGDIDLEIASEHVDAIAVPGDNEAACRAAIEEDGYLSRQLQEMDMEAAVGYLTDAGIEDAASKSNDDLRLYVLWMACHDINDERNMED